jgi:hypothetical protein
MRDAAWVGDPYDEQRQAASTRSFLCHNAQAQSLAHAPSLPILHRTQRRNETATASAPTTHCDIALSGSAATGGVPERRLRLRHARALVRRTRRQVRENERGKTRGPAAVTDVHRTRRIPHTQTPRRRRRRRPRQPAPTADLPPLPQHAMWRLFEENLVRSHRLLQRSVARRLHAHHGAGNTRNRRHAAGHTATSL